MSHGATEELEQDYPRSWIWDEDGDTCAGAFVRFDSGPTKKYGRKAIAILLIDGEERSIWLLETALYNGFRDEIMERPERTLSPGERIVARRGEKKRNAEDTRDYVDYKILFPDRPQPSIAELFELDKEKPEEKTEEESSPKPPAPTEPENSAPGPGSDIPF